MALSEGDKIRNFILMGLPTKLQEAFYEKYWNKIEECTGYDVSSFIRDYLSVKQGAIPQISRVYPTFKGYVEDSALETEATLIELLKYAKFYQTLRTGTQQMSLSIWRCTSVVTPETSSKVSRLIMVFMSGPIPIRSTR